MDNARDYHTQPVEIQVTMTILVYGQIDSIDMQAKMDCLILDDMISDRVKVEVASTLGHQCGVSNVDIKVSQHN